MDKLDRRDALKVIGTGVVVAGSGPAAFLTSRQAYAVQTGEQTEEQPPPQAEPPETQQKETAVEAEPDLWWLVAPLIAESKIGNYRLTSMRMNYGVIRAEMQKSDGELFYILICRRDKAPDAPQPVAHTSYYDLFLANGGKGSKPSNELEGLTAMTLTEIIAKNERRRAPLKVDTIRQRWSKQ